MKIKITDIGWGLDRKSGVRYEKILNRETFEAKVGLIMNMDYESVHKSFKITYLEKDRVDIQLREDKIMTFYHGDKFNYYPVTRDGGHYYVIEIK